MFGVDIRIILNSLFVLGALFAFWKGGAAERVTAIVVLVNVLVGVAGSQLAPQSEPIIRLVNDGLTAMVLLGVTLRYGTPWMGGVMLFFAAQFAMHSYYLVMQLPNDYRHALINNIDFSGIVWCLIIGTAVSWRRRVRLARQATTAPAASPEG